ncbi:hypothetical protein GCM10010211_80960 [Streptomyces albospinus]|uniref:Secreted protein n=1 Tax=Streptomyces albospinus TaxID=285515 RepID=A0ABQ2VN77_9ACTN|nr:hypothetical protein GCM10010211_80960 [Streptomyces albospinus]
MAPGTVLVRAAGTLLLGATRQKALDLPLAPSIPCCLDADTCGSSHSLPTGAISPSVVHGCGSVIPNLTSQIGGVFQQYVYR